jgi:hypothetical protein
MQYKNTHNNPTKANSIRFQYLDKFFKQYKYKTLISWDVRQYDAQKLLLENAGDIIVINLSSGSVNTAVAVPHHQ